MTSRITRALALTCGLLLALPPGWCCTVAFARPAPASSVSGVPVKAEPCCACCKTPAPAEKAPAPATPPVCQVCDPSPHALPPAVIAVDAPAEAAFCFDLPLSCDLFSSVPGAMTDALSFARPPTPPIHVSHCVWLC